MPDAATNPPPAVGHPRPAILYVGAVLPSLSETFVYRELFALRERGLRVEAASLRTPQGGLGEARLDQLAAGAIPIYGSGSAPLFADALAEAASHPVRAVHTIAAALADLVSGDGLGVAGRAKLLPQLAAAFALARRARRRGVARVHAHMAHAPATVAMYAARQLGVPFSFTGHANDVFVRASLLRRKIRRAAFVACISGFHREHYRRLAPRPDAAFPIIRCGVDVPEPSAPRDPSPELDVVGVARLVPKKGFDVLIEAVALLASRGVPVRATIIGGGEQRQALESLIARLNVAGRVTLAGPRPHRDALARVRQADLFVLPCRVSADGDRDGIPVSLMEAMAGGVCVVSGAVTPIEELVRHEETGVMVPPGDARALADAIESLHRDPARRVRLAQAGRRWVEREFSTPVNTDRMLRALAEGGPAQGSPSTSDQEATPACAV